jgi:hypothetical protein
MRPRRKLEDIKIDVKEILFEIFWLDSTGYGYGIVKGSCKDGNEHSSLMKDGEFLGHMNGYQLLKEESLSWH